MNTCFLYRGDVKARNASVYFEWIEISMLYLPQTYDNIFYGFKRDENKFF